MRKGVRYRIWGFVLLTALLSGAMEASAQHYIGVMGGWGGGSGRFKPKRETGTEWGLYTGGLSYKFYSETKYVGGIEVDLLFTQKGYNYDIAFQSDTSYHRRINAVELPLIWQPHVYLLKRHARFFINLGVQFSYHINSSYSWVSKQQGVYESGPYTMQLNRDNRFGYGLCGGAGLSFLLGPERRYEISLEARYSFGYSDILRNGTKYKGNPDRSPLNNINVFGAFYYRLGKGGLRSAPSAAATFRMEQEAARNTLRRLKKMAAQGGELSVKDSVLLEKLGGLEVVPKASQIDAATIRMIGHYLEENKPSASSILSAPGSLPGEEKTTPAAENGTKPAVHTHEEPAEQPEHPHPVPPVAPEPVKP